MDPFGQGFVEIIAAEQTPDNPNWFQGTVKRLGRQEYNQLLAEGTDGGTKIDQFATTLAPISRRQLTAEPRDG